MMRALRWLSVRKISLCVVPSPSRDPLFITLLLTIPLAFMTPLRIVTASKSQDLLPFRQPPAY
jgi:hypothetical protein